MATTRRTRKSTEATTDTSSLKGMTINGFKVGGDYKSKGEQKLAFAKSVKDESKDIQEQIEEEQKKSQDKSLWSSIGGALGGLVAGIATGGASAAIAGLATAGGTYIGSHGGKKVSEQLQGKRENIKSNMWYESEATAQNLAFDEFDEKINEGILTKSLSAGAMAFAVNAGTKFFEKQQLSKLDTFKTPPLSSQESKLVENKVANFTSMNTDEITKIQQNLVEKGYGDTLAYGNSSGVDGIAGKRTVSTYNKMIADELKSQTGSLVSNADTVQQNLSNLIFDKNKIESSLRKIEKGKELALQYGVTGLLNYKPELDELRNINIYNQESLT